MSASGLTRLKSVDLRDAWTHEAQDFTPWLADNLDRLSEELGVDLELEDKEVQVGRYWADIVANVPQDGTRVLIENQLEDADLQHLGQVLAYLAGLEAQIVVWVAKSFDEVHLSAIRWLNEHTADPFAFFAVRIRVVRIGDSPLAPVFDVLERPNAWNRQVKSASRRGELSDLGMFWRDFWAHMKARRPDAPSLRPDYALSRVWHPVEASGLYVVQYLRNSSVGVNLERLNSDETRAETQSRIEPYAKALGKALNGESLRERKNHFCITELRVDSQNRNNWDQMVDWLDERRQTYEKVLRSGPASPE